MANQSMDRPSTTLLTLPPEIRESIYRLILTPDANRLSDPDEYINYDYSAAFVLFKLNHQIYLEARKVFRDLNVFVRIETPWPEAQAHVPRPATTIAAKAQGSRDFRWTSGMTIGTAGPGSIDMGISSGISARSTAGRSRRRGLAMRWDVPR